MSDCSPPYYPNKTLCLTVQPFACSQASRLNPSPVLFLPPCTASANPCAILWVVALPPDLPVLLSKLLHSAYGRFSQSVETLLATFRPPVLMCPSCCSYDEILLTLGTLYQGGGVEEVLSVANLGGELSFPRGVIIVVQFASVRVPVRLGVTLPAVIMGRHPAQIFRSPICNWTNS